MKLLAIDAATEACSVALSIGDQVYQRHAIAPRGHAQRLLNMVDKVLQAGGIGIKSLDAIAFDRGPGSFTGVRVGTSVTQGLAFGADLPVIPVSSLATLAQGAWRELGQTHVLSVIDARMEEVYWGYYVCQDGVMCLQGDEQVSNATAVSLVEGDWYGAGSGWPVYPATLPAATQGVCTTQDATYLPQAVDILDLARPCLRAGEIVAADKALPTYLRNEVARKQSGV